MILRTTPTSPFGRKALMAAHHLGLMDRIEMIGSDPMKSDDPLRKDNPLGKMPALILDDGRCIFDSRVILEHFDHMAGGNRIIPADWDKRLAVLTTQALSDGIMDAALLVAYEARHRPEALHHEPWLAFQRAKIERGLTRLVAAPPSPREVNVATISMSCMFGYLDWRKQVDWRRTSPALVDWLAAFRETTPTHAQTEAP